MSKINIRYPSTVQPSQIWEGGGKSIEKHYVMVLRVDDEYAYCFSCGSFRETRIKLSRFNAKTTGYFFVANLLDLIEKSKGFVTPIVNERTFFRFLSGFLYHKDYSEGNAAQLTRWLDYEMTRPENVDRSYPKILDRYFTVYLPYAKNLTAKAKDIDELLFTLSSRGVWDERTGLV